MEHAAARRRAEQTQTGRAHPGAEEYDLDADDDIPWRPPGNAVGQVSRDEEQREQHGGREHARRLAEHQFGI